MIERLLKIKKKISTMNWVEIQKNGNISLNPIYKS